MGRRLAVIYTEVAAHFLWDDFFVFPGLKAFPNKAGKIRPSSSPLMAIEPKRQAR